MITERLLQFIWEKRYYNVRNMETVQGDKLEVVEPGTLNKNQGPDFLVGFLRIGENVLVGNIEVHVKSSDWFKHAHQYDSNYGNVILHVVWERDDLAPDLPTFELKGRVSLSLLEHYQQLMMAPVTIACANLLPVVKEVVWEKWKVELLRQRLIRKTVAIRAHLDRTMYNWDEVVWWQVGRAFGLPVNGDAFEAIVRSVPLVTLQRLRNDPRAVEAILLGQAGMLEGRFTEEYPNVLQKEYRYQVKKLGLKQPAMQVKSLRMRPASLPGVRIAQLAALVANSHQLLQRCREATDLDALKNSFSISASPYWDTHYRFDEVSAETPKKTGDHLLNVIILNAVVPVVFTYGRLNYMNEVEDKAIQWLFEIRPEKNKYLNQWRNYGVRVQNAADSQALLELSVKYCTPRRCLDCNIARSLLENKEQSEE